MADEASVVISIYGDIPYRWHDVSRGAMSHYVTRHDIDGDMSQVVTTHYTRESLLLKHQSFYLWFKGSNPFLSTKYIVSL